MINIEEAIESMEQDVKEVEEKEEETNQEVKDVVDEEVKEETKTTNVEPEVVKDPEFIMPVEGEIVRSFAKDSLIYSETLEEWIVHLGIDIKADRTTVVKAAEAGTITAIKNDPRYGLTVIIEHEDGYKTVYSKLSIYSTNLLSCSITVYGLSAEYMLFKLNLGIIVILLIFVLLSLCLKKRY